MEIVPTIEDIKNFTRDNKWLFLGSQSTDKDETAVRWLTPAGNQVTLTYRQEQGEIVHIKFSNT